MLDLPTFEQIQKGLQFKYYGVAGDTPFLRAVYSSGGYEHSIVIPLMEEYAKIIDQRIHESLLAMRAYRIENPEDNVPAQIVKSNPSKVVKQPETGTMIVNVKTPKQLEKEAEEEADRIGDV